MALQQKQCNKSKKRKVYEDRDEIIYEPKRKKMKFNDHNNRHNRKRPVILMEKGTQTHGPPPLDPQQIEAEITQRFEILFGKLFREKMNEIKQDNDEWRQFLKMKMNETNVCQNEYG